MLNFPAYIFPLYVWSFLGIWFTSRFFFGRARRSIKFTIFMGFAHVSTLHSLLVTFFWRENCCFWLRIIIKRSFMIFVVVIRAVWQISGKIEKNHYSYSEWYYHVLYLHIGYIWVEGSHHFSTLLVFPFLFKDIHGTVRFLIGSKWFTFHPGWT